MMTPRSLAILSGLICIFTLSKTDAKTPIVAHTAQPRTVSVPHPLYILRLSYALGHVRIADVSPKQCVWELRMQPTNHVVSPPAPNNVFQSLNAPQLRDWISHLPPGSCITGFVWLGHIRIKSDMILPAQLQSEIEDFQRYCQSKKVNFAMFLSGG